MLTCIAKTGEFIVIDDMVCFTLLGINEREVLLGFDPKNKISIHRKKATAKTSNVLQQEAPIENK